MPNWSVQLTGDKFDLEDLPKWFTTPDLQVVEELDGYYLKSDLFEAIEEAEQVRALAQEMLQFLVGAAKLFRPNFMSVELGAVTRQENDGRRHRHVFLSSSIVARSKVSSAKLTVNGSEEGPQVPRPAVWAAVAKDDEKVHQALRLWVSSPDSWVNLYKILEVIESDVGDAIYGNAWVSKTEVTRFTQTANSAEAIGDEARHAKKHVPPPPRPMTIQEAKQLMKALLEKWIESKTPSKWE
jgi:hypothetical protein